MHINMIKLRLTVNLHMILQSYGSVLTCVQNNILVMYTSLRDMYCHDIDDMTLYFGMYKILVTNFSHFELGVRI